MPIVYPVFELVADPKLPIVRGRRDLRASPQQIFWAHTDPESFARWFGPADRTTRILYWDARPGGGFRYVCSCQDDRDAYCGAFHEVRPDRIVQTFASESMPDEIALETIRIIDLHDGVTRVELESHGVLRGPRPVAVRRARRGLQPGLRHARAPRPRAHGLTRAFLPDAIHIRGWTSSHALGVSRRGTAGRSRSAGPRRCRRRPPRGSSRASASARASRSRSPARSRRRRVRGR